MPSFDSLIVARRDSPEVIYPLDAAPTSFATGTSSAFSAWQQVVASLPSGFVLTRIIATLDVLGGAFHGGRIEVGIGAATFEVAIAELAFHSLLFDPVADDAGRQDLSWVPGNFYYIPSGTRVAVRAYVTTTAARTVYIYLQGFDVRGPVFAKSLRRYRQWAAGVATKASLTIPETGGGATPSPGSTWTYSSWVEHVAAAADDLLVHGLTINAPSALKISTHNFVQVGVGASPNETPICGGGGAYGVRSYYFDPPALVRKGERIAIRGKSSATGALGASVLQVTALK